MIELGYGQRRGIPGFSAVQGNLDTAVVAVDHAPGISRVDPDVMVVAVLESLDLLDSVAAIDTPQHRHLREPDHIRVVGVDSDRGVVEGSLADAVAAVHEGPAVTPVIGPVKTAL